MPRAASCFPAGLQRYPLRSVEILALAGEGRARRDGPDPQISRLDRRRLAKERQLFQGPVGLLQTTILKGDPGRLHETRGPVPNLAGLDPRNDLGQIGELLAVVDVLLDPASGGLDDILRRSVRRQAEQLPHPDDIGPGSGGLATGGARLASRIPRGRERDAEFHPQRPHLGRAQPCPLPSLGKGRHGPRQGHARACDDRQGHETRAEALHKQRSSFVPP